MSGEDQTLPPPVLWAQRHPVVFLTFCVEDCKNPDIKIDADKVYFKGVGGTEKKTYEITLNLFKEIDPEKSIKAIRDRNIELVLKKDQDGYWPTLLKEKVKYHWLKVDFNKWKDEDDSEDDTEPNGDLEAMMRQMGGVGGLGGGDGKPDFEDIDPLSDSDDEELPGLE